MKLRNIFAFCFEGCDNHRYGRRLRFDAAVFAGRSGIAINVNGRI